MLFGENEGDSCTQTIMLQKMWDAKTLTNIQLSLPHMSRNSNQTK